MERRIRIIKRLVRVTIGESKLSPLGMQTVLFEAANLCNERPLGVNNKVQDERTYIVLTPNCLLMGRATNGPITDAFMESKLKIFQKFGLVWSSTKHIRDRWSVVVTEKVAQNWMESKGGRFCTSLQ